MESTHLRELAIVARLISESEEAEQEAPTVESLKSEVSEKINSVWEICEEISDSPCDCLEAAAALVRLARALRLSESEGVA
jgi:hypothetical protein